MPVPLVPIAIGTIVGIGVSSVITMIAMISGHKDGTRLQKEYDKESQENKNRG